MKPFHKDLILLFVAMCILTACCGTLKNGRGWGQDATVFPGWRRVGDAALDAAIAPETWVPLAGAVVLQADAMDKRLSNWASNHTPVFGSQSAADDASSLLRESTSVAYIITMLATPSGDTPESWAIAKLKGFTVGTMAISSTTLTTNSLKQNTHRLRPDASTKRSFPSLHTSDAAVNATLASKNLESLLFKDGVRTALRIGFFSHCRHSLGACGGEATLSFGRAHGCLPGAFLRHLF
jgi:predicted small secreted protein